MKSKRIKHCWIRRDRISWRFVEVYPVEENSMPLIEFLEEFVRRLKEK